MGLFSSESLRTFQSLYLTQLRDLYSAEEQLLDALPQMASAAALPTLRAAFEQHLAETRQHLRRLQQVFDALGESTGGLPCEAMAVLLRDGKEILTGDADPAVRDAALIAAARRVEHYEIAGYDTACTCAERIGREDDARLLRLTLDEEKAADAHLTRVAEGLASLQTAQD